MTQWTKLKEKFQKNPESISYQDLEIILKKLGFKKKEAKGSHQKFIHHSLPLRVIIPVHNRDCAPIYKRTTLKAILKEGLIS